MSVEFVNLHSHTNLGSMLDAMCGIDELFDKIKELGQKALAITDHGTLAAHFDAFKAYKRTGVKFIPGFEAYFVNSYDFIPTETKRKRTERRKHLILLAQNETGYKNLLKINYAGFHNFVLVMGRVFPRISWETLENHSDGIICTSACASGPLSALIMSDKLDEVEDVALRFQSIFGERFYIEIQPHHLKNENIDQKLINENLIRTGHKLGIPLTVGVDTHYLTRDSEKYHDTLMAINSKAPVDDPNRHRYGIDEFYAKSGQEVYDFLSKHYGEEVADEAVGNTVKIADMCIAPDYMESKGNHLPVFNPRDEGDYEEFVKWRETARMSKDLKEDITFMRFRIVKGFKEKFGDMGPEDRKIRWERVLHELKVLEGNNFSSYMLVTADFIKWAKENGILVGVGRGCLGPRTLVLSEFGYKKLKDLKIGDNVYSHLGKLRSIENTFNYEIENEELVRIKTGYSYDTIDLTKDHRVFASKTSNKDPVWMRAQDIAPGYFIFIPWPSRKIEETPTIDLANYTYSDRIDYKINNENILKPIKKSGNFSARQISKETGLQIRTINNIRNDNIHSNRNTIQKISSYVHKHGVSFNQWKNINLDYRKYDRYVNQDEAWFYMLGRWVGDGFISDGFNNSKNYSYRIGFSLNKNDERGARNIKLYFSRLGFKSIMYVKKENAIQVEIYDKILVNLFRRIFKYYKNSSDTKHLCGFRHLNKNKLRSLILGLKHADGHTAKNGVEDITTTSQRLVLEIREALLYLNIPSSIVVSEPRKSIYNDKTVNHKRSYHIYFTGLETTPSRTIKSRLLTNGYYTKISNIDTITCDRVYDISVSEDFSYITQNFAVHNSVGGCMVAYLLDIHGVDPIEYGLLFERFQNAYKTDLPDIDTDFTSSGRDKVQDYVRRKYGYDHCATVSNINSYTAKSVIPDLVKSMRNVMPGLVPEGTNYVRVSEAIKKTIPEQDDKGKGVETLEKAMELSPDLRRFANRCPELMEYADKIVGMPKEFSTHAAAMVISDTPIIEFAPLRIDKNGDVAVQYEKNRCESLGLVKMDFLAISTLDVIDETFKNIKRLGMDGPKTMEDVPMGDQKTYEMIQNGHTKCVFQLGRSGMMVTLCKKVKPNNISDIAVINALGRPSCSKEERQEYIDRRFGKKKVSYLHPSLEKVLSSTYGLCIMEEQLMGVAQDVAGWDLNKTDGLRKLTKLKGKNPKLALQLEVDFIKGMMDLHNVEYEFAKRIWDEIILPFAGYGFNKAHAVFYSINGYITAYLKCHCPTAFLAAYLKIKTQRGLSREEEIAMAKEECQRIGIKIIPPDINRSGSNYEVLDENSIVMGFAAIKGLGKKAVAEIVNNQPYDSLSSFLFKTAGRVINKTRVEVLAKAGCFDSFNVSRKSIHDNAKKNRDKMSAFIRNKTKDGYDASMIVDECALKIEKTEWQKQELLRYEQEVLSELISGDINDMFPGFFTGVNATPISRLRFLPDRHNIIVEFLVKSMLREFKIKSGRYKGRWMIKFRVKDVGGAETELTVWPDSYEIAKKIMKEGRPVRAKCQISEFNGVKTLMLRGIEKAYGM